jgi:malonate-semialdehyde dehydrogenase (acetylating)/methylmalonate-semialdehyde dehydrogenase
MSQVLGNYIDGNYIILNNSEHIEVTTPHSGEVIATVPMSNKEDVHNAVEAANKAFFSWSRITIKNRAKIIIKFHSLIEKYCDELADLIVKEHGKTKSEALAEVAKGNETVEYAMGMPQLAQGKYLEVSRGVTCRDERHPLGVVVSIVPFNFPFMVPFWTICHALVLGNTVVLKPSEKVPLTMNRVMSIFQEAGLPAGVINLVNGSADTVMHLCDHPLVTAVTFVGTTKVAEIVHKRCRNLNKRTLCLGGAKNHLIASPDCDMEMTSQDVVNSFSGCTGQRCMADSVLLLIGNQQNLIDLIVEKASKLIPGSGNGHMGPVIDIISRNRIVSYIERAEQNGNTILLDGRSWTSRKGFWVGPTVILCKNKDDRTMLEEIFGPVLSIYVCKDGLEAIEIENSNPYGNAACIYTENGKTAEWFTDRFSAGMLGVNIGVPVPREPFSFGGIRDSKFGDSDITGDGGIEFFSYRKKVTTKWTVPKQQSWMS